MEIFKNTYYEDLIFNRKYFEKMYLTKVPCNVLFCKNKSSEWKLLN